MSRAALAHDVKSADGLKSKPGSSTLRVNKPGDAHEREADLIAERVTSGKARNASWSLSRVRMGTSLQRECSCGGTCEDCKEKKEQMLQRKPVDEARTTTFAPAIVHDVLSGPGMPLDQNTRGFMESRFGYDFGRVRIFNDATAAKSARAVSSHAYTVGDKIVFNQGRYSPESQSGRRLLAHELAHVVQQGSTSSSCGSALPVGDLDDTTEQAAHRAAHACEKPDGSATSESAGAMALAARVSGPRVQRFSYKEAKEAVYKEIIEGARKANHAYIALLRAAASLLPAALQGPANTLIDIDDVIIGALIAVALGVIGIVVGAGEGIADMVRGLVTMIAGVGKTIYDVITGFFTNFDAAKQDFNKFVDALKGLPGAVKAMVVDWLDRFQKASSERQSLMIGELTGQIIALIATWELSAGRAGTAAKVAGEGAEVVDAAAAAADVTATATKSTTAVVDATTTATKGTAVITDATATATKGTAVATDVAATASKGSAAARAAKLGWGGLVKGGTKAATEGAETTSPLAATADATSVASKGSAAASTAARTTARAATTEGNAALKLAPAVEEAPKFVPKIVPPPPVEAPVVERAVAAATQTGVGKGVTVAGGIAAAKGTQISQDAQPDPAEKKKKKKKPCEDAQPCGVLPIIWPGSLLPVPPDAELVRTKGDLREVLGTDRGANQANFSSCIRNWKQNPNHMDLESACPGHGFYQQGLQPSEPIDAHHIHPLYLGGGDDWQGNLGAVETMQHRQGHRELDNQQQMFDTDPTWAQCQICSPLLSKHPVDQEYVIEPT